MDSYGACPQTCWTFLQEEAWSQRKGAGDIAMTVRKRRCSIVVRKEELSGEEHSRKVGITAATGQQRFGVE